jgi:hypothetical protein
VRAGARDRLHDSLIADDGVFSFRVCFFSATAQLHAVPFRFPPGNP